MTIDRRRRCFLGGAAAAVATAFSSCSRSNDGSAGGGGVPNEDPKRWWRDGHFVQKTVDTSALDSGEIRARIDGTWRALKTVDLPERFVRWSLEQRQLRLQELVVKGFDPRDLDGPHNACVATYGGPNRDSVFSLNTAYKGMGFVPVAEKLVESTEKLRSARSEIERKASGDFVASIRAKTNFLGHFYRTPGLFDRRKQISLELFTTPDYMTHTFLNMMANPIASASFLAYPTFELRAVPQLLHPENPGLAAHERSLIAYANAVHDFVHHGSGQSIACVYHVIEVFDDTPTRGAHGAKIA